MEVLLLTVFLSTLLAAVFLLLFWRDRKQPTQCSMEQDSLRPFAVEKSVEDLRQ